MNQNLRVAAVFATMNRASTAVSCLRTLAGQTRPPDLVVVADNVSTDSTVRDLESQPALPFELLVIRMAENRGNAGGVEAAMDAAFLRGADAVWILDDDSWPRPDALAELLCGIWSPEEVRFSIQIDPRTSNLTWPMQYATDDGWAVAHSLDQLPSGRELGSRNNWTGSLVPARVWEMIGPVMGALFIRGEDEEYPWRMEGCGIRQKAITRSVLDHPGPARLVATSFLGRRIYYEPGLADWKLYYKVRNMVWLQRRKRGALGAAGMMAAYAWTVARHDGLSRLALLMEAGIDGWMETLGRWRHHPDAVQTGSTSERDSTVA